MLIRPEAEYPLPAERLERLTKVILYVLRELGSKVPVTKLIKTLFLIDYHAIKRLRKPILGVRWVHYHYGPYSFDVARALEYLLNEGVLYREHVEKEGTRYNIYEIADTRMAPSEEEMAALMGESGLKVLRAVVSEVRPLKVEEIRRLAMVEEVRDTPLGEEIVVLPPHEEVEIGGLKYRLIRVPTEELPSAIERYAHRYADVIVVAEGQAIDELKRRAEELVNKHRAMIRRLLRQVPEERRSELDKLLKLSPEEIGELAAEEV